MKIINFFLITMLLLLLLFNSYAWSSQMSYLPGMLLGRGYDIVSGDVKGDCMNFSVHQEPSTAIYQAEWLWEECSSNSDLVELLQMDGGASVNAGLFSVSAEMGLLSENILSNYNYNLLASAKIKLRWDIALNASMKSQAEQLFQSNPNQFQNQYGTHYILGILYGGTLYSIITINTSSQSDKEQIEASARASYGPFSGGGNISSQFSSLLRDRNATIRGYGTGLGPQAIPMNPDQLNQRFSNFPNEVVTSGGAPVSIILAPYGNLAPQVYDSTNLAIERWDYVSLKREIEYILNHPDQFYMDLSTWEAFLIDLKNKANQGIQNLDLAINNCRQNQSNCTRPANLSEPDEIRRNLPPRYTGSCGPTNLNLTNFTMNVYPLSNHTRGDTEMDGNNPSIRITSKFKAKQNGAYLDMETYVRMKEGKTDWTTFSDTQDSTISIISNDYPGCYVESTATTNAIPSTGLLTANGGDDNHSWTNYTGGSGILKSARCRSDTRGNDRGDLGCKNIKFQNARINLAHIEDKMGPNELNQVATNVWRNKEIIKLEIKRIIRKRNNEIVELIEKVESRTGADIDEPTPQRIIPVTPFKTPRLRFADPSLRIPPSP